MSTCSICLQECEDETRLPCGHTFHAECLVPWLWKSSSCPNCRFSESKNQEDIADVNDIRTMIQEIRANREEQNRKFRMNMQKSKNKSAPKSLVKTVRTYKKCKEKIKEDIFERNNLQKCIDETRKETNTQLNCLYKNYLKEYTTIERNQKNSVKDESKKLRNISRKLRRHNSRLLELRHNIIEYDQN